MTTSFVLIALVYYFFPDFALYVLGLFWEFFKAYPLYAALLLLGK